MLLNYLIEFIYKVSGFRKCRALDLSVLEIIKNCDIDKLRSHKYLEQELLPSLGLNNELMHQYPKALHHACGFGMYSWQYPIQFGKYLSTLSQFSIRSYLEIGVRHGGTFMITLEYLKRFCELDRALAIDLYSASSLEAYAKTTKNVEFFVLNSGSRKFGTLVQERGPFDLVMIDGNHLEEGCKKDFFAVKEYATIIVLHDIASDTWGGVGNVWNHIKMCFHGEYYFHEYIEQYTSVKGNHLGIGVAIKKNAPRI